MGGRPSGGQPGRAPSLPPLNQSTGELPKVPSSVSATGQGFASAGEQLQSAENTVVVSGMAGGVFSQLPEEPEGFDAPMPSALPPMEEAVEQVADATGVMPSIPAADALADIDLTDGPSMGGIRGDLSPTDPFPETPSAFSDRAAAAFPGPGGPVGAAPDVGSSAPETRSFDGQPMAAAGAIGGVNSLDAPADARSVSGRDTSLRPGQSAQGGAGERLQAKQRRGEAGAGVGAIAGARPKRDADAANRLQDTEFKLADKRRKQKPKEPNKLVLGLAAALVILVGVAVAFLLTRGEGDTTDDVAVDANATGDTLPEAESLEDAAPAVETTTPEIQVDEPTLVFEAAQTGPLSEDQTYSIDLLGEPEGALLQVVVDGLPQAEPAPQLPDLILPAGRHSLYIQITNGAEQTLSTPVEVYVIGAPPAAGYRANLSSVDMQTEGWVEAIRQFDEYRDAGHEGLQMAPISEGYWNIFVGGLGEDSAAATSYCESFNLAMPEECFAVLTDATAGAPATTVLESPDSTTATTEVMEDSTTVTTAAGG